MNTHQSPNPQADKSDFTVADAINGMMHLSDDHKCCSTFVFAVIDLINKQQHSIETLKRMLSARRKVHQDHLCEALNTGDGSYKP